MTESSRKDDRFARGGGRRFEWTRRLIGSSGAKSLASSATLSSSSSTSSLSAAAESASDADGSGSTWLQVSNPSAPIPAGIQHVPGFVSPLDEILIEREIDDNLYWKEGFDVKRRVQRFRLSAETNADNDAAAAASEEKECLPMTEIPPSLLRLSDRFREETGLVAQRVTVEEIPVAGFQGMRKGEFASEHVVTTFDSPPLGPDQENSGSGPFFVACVPIGRSVIQHVNRPSRRSANCWRLESPNHWFDVQINRGSLYVRRGESLHSWRSCFVASIEEEEEEDERGGSVNSASACETIRVIKFYAIPAGGDDEQEDEEKAVSRNSEERDAFGYKPDVDEAYSRPNPMPPLPDLLTIVVTTSPIRSNPSTELLEKAMDTFAFGGTEFAHSSRKVIVCDGFRTKDEGNHAAVSRKHANTKQAMRNGIVTPEQAQRYGQFKDALKALCASATESSPFHNTTVEELDSRHGYGFALKHALCHCVTTPYVCVVQHDRTFMRPTPIREIVQAMWNHPRVKYVGMSMRSNLMYKDLFLSKYGRVYFDQLGDMIFRPHELLLDAARFGPRSDRSADMVVTSEKVRNSLLDLADTYRSSRHNLDYTSWLEKQESVDPERQQLSLTPTLFWYDNVHIAETAHYRDFVFKPSYQMVARGGFVEDKLSPVLIKTVERLGLREGHARFGCFLLDDHSGCFFTGHLDGGTYTPSPAAATGVADDTDKLV